MQNEELISRIAASTTRLGNRPLIVHSGGQDSTTCLALARAMLGDAVIHTVGFDYGQKHTVELECAKYTADYYGAVRHPLISVPFLQNNVTTELLASATGDVSNEHAYLSGRPASFVPARNALFLTMAFGLAIEIGATSIVTGVCQADDAGYPDCRDAFVQLLNTALNTGYEQDIPIITPLMRLNKALTWQAADAIGELDIIVNHTHTCYNGDHETLHEWGYGCGECPACKTRAEGFYAFKASQ